MSTIANNQGTRDDCLMLWPLVGSDIKELARRARTSRKAPPGPISGETRLAGRRLDEQTDLGRAATPQVRPVV